MSRAHVMSRNADENELYTITDFNVPHGYSHDMILEAVVREPDTKKLIRMPRNIMVLIVDHDYKRYNLYQRTGHITWDTIKKGEF
jgi:hypothetical protein